MQLSIALTQFTPQRSLDVAPFSLLIGLLCRYELPNRLEWDVKMTWPSPQAFWADSSVLWTT